jgi:cold-inducible RNA-binding protein
MRGPTLAFPKRHTQTDVRSRAYLIAAEGDRLRIAARRVRRYLSSLPFSGGVERLSSASRSVPGAPALPRHVSAVGRWQGARTAWAEDRVTVCTHALGEPDMNIFVGNLAFTTTEQSLRQLFEPHGAVDTVQIMTDRETGRSRGFGFVEMPDGTAARAAIAGLQGQELDSRTLTINEARPREDRREPRRSRW